jgi:hypothetical protein
VATDDRAVLTERGTGVTVQWSAMHVTEQGSAMHHAEPHSAAARDGPLANEGGLTIAKQEGSGRWPTPVVWAAPAGERHVYELMAVEVRKDLALACLRLSENSSCEGSRTRNLLGFSGSLPHVSPWTSVVSDQTNAPVRLFGRSTGSLPFSPPFARP